MTVMAMPTARIILCALAVGLLLTGCTQHPRPVATPEPTLKAPPPTGKPVLDFSRGVAAIPLAVPGVPATMSDLVMRIRQALQSRLTLPDPESAIETIGASFNSLDLLQINLSNATLNADFKPRQLKRPGKVKPLLAVRRFEYVADPLRYQEGSSSLLIEADDARLGLLHDPEKNQDALILTGATRGELTFSVPINQLKPMSLAGARRHAKAGLSIHDIDLKLVAAPDGRGIKGTLAVQATWLLLPTTFLITGQAELNQWNYLVLSNLRCKGTNFGGMLLSGLIEDAMRRHEGKTMPLAVWPDHHLKVTSVDIRTDTNLRLKVDFAAADE